MGEDNNNGEEKNLEKGFNSNNTVKDTRHSSDIGHPPYSDTGYRVENSVDKVYIPGLGSNIE